MASNNYNEPFPNFHSLLFSLFPPTRVTFNESRDYVLFTTKSSEITLATQKIFFE